MNEIESCKYPKAESQVERKYLALSRNGNGRAAREMHQCRQHEALSIGVCNVVNRY